MLMSDTSRNPPGRVAELKLRHFEVLLAIARCGTLTAAADALGISQPAASQWLADMESALGVPLFIRGRPLRQTPFAEAVLRHARRVLADAQRTQEEIEALRNGAVGRVRLGIMSAAAPILLPRVVRRLRESAPGLRLVVFEDIWAGLWPRFERDELDMLIGRPEGGMRSGAWPTERLYDDPHVVIAGPHHPLVRARRITWTDIARYPLILPPASTPLRGAIDATFVNAGLPMPQPWIESTSQSANYAVLRESDALAVSSRASAHHFAALGLVRALPVRLSTDVGPLGMVWRDVAPDPVLARVLDAVRTEAQAMTEAPHP